MRSPLTPLWRAALLALTTLAVVPASASAAATVQLATSPDPVEDVTYQVTVSGTTDARREVWVNIKPAGGRACAPSFSADDGSNLIYGDDRTGAFSIVVNETTYASGAYLLCAWVQDDSSDAIAQALTTLPMTVRVPTATASVQVPAVLQPGTTFQIATTVQTEVERRVYEAVNHPGVPCGANWAANASYEGVIEYQSVTGGPTTITENFTAPATPGVYPICGYIQEDSSDTVPEATFIGQFEVPAPPPPPSVVTTPSGSLSARRCGTVGTPARVRRVRARNTTCLRARRLARFWGRSPRVTGRFLGFRCTRSGSFRIRCTRRAAVVSFRWGAS